MDRYGMRQPWGASISTPSRLEKVDDGEFVKYSNAMAEIATKERDYQVMYKLHNGLEAEVAELEKQNKSLRIAVNHWKNDGHNELSAHIERLREFIETKCKEKQLIFRRPMERLFKETPAQSLAKIQREAFKDGYEQGHYATVESMGFYPDEAADEYIKELKE